MAKTLPMKFNEWIWTVIKYTYKLTVDGWDFKSANLGFCITFSQRDICSISIR